MQNQDIVKLLRSAGLAVKALTRTMSTTSGDSSSHVVSVKQQKESFAGATSSYFALVSSLDVRLRRQIYALEEADILRAETSSKESMNDPSVPWGASVTAGGSNGPPPRSTWSGRASITGGGLGSLDVGWLNSRNDSVAKGKETELWYQAQQFIQDFEEGKASKVEGKEENSAAMQSTQTHHISDQMEHI
jgi:hypothetical protein